MRNPYLYMGEVLIDLFRTGLRGGVQERRWCHPRQGLSCYSQRRWSDYGCFGMGVISKLSPELKAPTKSFNDNFGFGFLLQTIPTHLSSYHHVLQKELGLPAHVKNRHLTHRLGFQKYMTKMYED